MNQEDILKRVTEKREFSQVPEKDIEVAYSHFVRRQTSDEEKIRLTRELLHKVFGAFGSKKLLSPKDKDAKWILRKHISTRERLPFYKEIYKRILKNAGKRVSAVDLGCGINGFSYDYFKELGVSVNYVGVEALGQLVDLTNQHFKRNQIKGKVIHASLFKLEKVKDIIKKEKKPRIVFLFKTLDSLEMLKRDYSFRLLEEVSKISDKVCVSFATRSLVKRERFRAKRAWLTRFIEEKFKITDDFELGGERYIVFKNRTKRNQNFIEKC